MKKLYCVICGKYRKCKNPKISYIFEKTLVFSFICSKCKNKDQKMFKKQKLFEILIVLRLIENI